MSDPVNLRALGTYPMPGPVKRGTVFQRPAEEASRYLRLGWAETVASEPKPTARVAKRSKDAHPDASEGTDRS